MERRFKRQRFARYWPFVEAGKPVTPTAAVLDYLIDRRSGALFETWHNTNGSGAVDTPPAYGFGSRIFTFIRHQRMHILNRARAALRTATFYATVPPVRRWLRSRWETEADTPPVGLVRFGSLRRLEPISRDWGDDRGGPIDRYYITNFLDRNRHDVQGRVLEIAEDVYAKWFGDDRVGRIDVLEYRKGEHPRATFVGDLTNAPHIPSDSFDCVILTQTLQLIYDLRSAIGTVHRILKPGGVALVTLPGITPVNRQDTESWGNQWCWSFTGLSARRLFEEYFPRDGVQVETFGNVLVAASFLYGLGRGELAQHELDHRDADYEMVITLRAQKEAAS